MTSKGRVNRTENSVTGANNNSRGGWQAELNFSVITGVTASRKIKMFKWTQATKKLNKISWGKVSSGAKEREKQQKAGWLPC